MWIVAKLKKNEVSLFEKEIRKAWYKTIHSERKKFSTMEHLAHQDLNFRDRCSQIIKNSKTLIK